MAIALVVHCRTICNIRIITRRGENSSGAETLELVMGRSKFKYRMGQILSGIDPDSSEGALSLMCVAIRGYG